MIRNALLDIINYIWPMIVIIVVILLTYRLTDIILNKKKFVLYREAINLAVILYLLCMFYVVTFEDVSWSSYNLVLFDEIKRYTFGSKLFFKNVVSNVIMFIPYGFFLSYYLKTKKGWVILLLGFITSCSIELTQFTIGRVFDIDDILLNVIGAIIGFTIYYLFEALRNKIPSIFKRTWFLNIVTVVILLFMGMYLFNLFNIGELF